MLRAHGPQQVNPSELCVPPWGRPGVWECPRNWLADVFLVGCCGGDWESASSFWFQPAWGLHACGQHTVNFFHLLEVSVSAKQLKEHGLEYCPHSLRKNEKSLTLFNGCSIIILACLAVFLSLLTSMIKFIHWQRVFHRQKAGRGHGWGLFWEGLRESCSVTLFL